MTAVELYNYLHNIIKEHGNCEIFHWDVMSMKYIETISAKFIEQNDIDPRLKSDKEYWKYFQNILGNIVLS